MIEHRGFKSGEQLRAFERLSHEDKRSVDILNMLQNSGTFAERDNKVRFFIDARASTQLADIEIEHFFEAVNYFCVHHASPTRVKRELMKKDGVIPVYEYGPYNIEDNPQILCEIQSHKAVEMLEFAFLLARKQIKS